MNSIKIKLERLHFLLDKKYECLTQIYNITENQEMFFCKLKGEDLKYFLGESIKEKEILIKEVNSIDDEFLLIFNSFNGKLNEYIESFKDSINLMKEKVKKITDLDIKIKIKEEKNSTRNLENKINAPKVTKDYILNKYKENSSKI